MAVEISTGGRVLRKDARENRERLLAVAAAAFAERGLDTGVEELAQGAGVGVGTLYRHFPTKAALIDAVYAQRIDRFVAIAEDGLDEDDAWDGLAGYLAGALELLAADRGLAEAVGGHREGERITADARVRLAPRVEELIDRARAAGGLRSDVVYEDIAVLIWTGGVVIDSTREIAPEFWRRYLGLVLDGLRAPGTSVLPSPPLTREQRLEAARRARHDAS